MSIIALFSALVMLALPAIVFGALGAHRADENGNHGDKMGIVAIILGVLEIVVLPLILWAIFSSSGDPTPATTYSDYRNFSDFGY